MFDCVNIRFPGPTNSLLSCIKWDLFRKGSTLNKVHTTNTMSKSLLLFHGILVSVINTILLSRLINNISGEGVLSITSVLSPSSVGLFCVIQRNQKMIALVWLYEEEVVAFPTNQLCEDNESFGMKPTWCTIWKTK